tara:strand:- start:106 stop:687 length:582 start_codon:yes stop_codon:yes gene_type:complete
MGLFGKKKYPTISKDGKLYLKCLEAYQRDVGTRRIRMDFESMEAIGCTTGDFVVIHGKRMTVLICLELLDPRDDGKQIMRIDGLERNNTGLSIGDIVSVAKVRVVPAEKIVLAPLQKLIEPEESELLTNFDRKPVVKGDNVFFRTWDGNIILFMVIGVEPKSEAVQVIKSEAKYEDTRIYIAYKEGVDYGQSI